MIFCFFILGIFFGAIFQSEFQQWKSKKSNDLLLQKNGECITLDFSDSSKRSKIQFFNDYFIQFYRDHIIIWSNSK